MPLTVTDRGTGSHNTASTGVTINVNANIAPGSIVVLVAAYDNAGSGGADPYLSLGDALGNTWNPAQAALYDPGAASAGCVVRISWCRQNIGAIQTTTNISLSFGVNVTAKAWALYEISSDIAGARCALVGGLTGVNAGAATGSPTVTTGTILAGMALMGAGASESGDTWVEDGDSSNGTWSTKQSAAAGTGATGMSVIAQSKVVTADATQTFNPTLTSADCILAWAAFMESPPFPYGHAGGGADGAYYP